MTDAERLSGGSRDADRMGAGPAFTPGPLEAVGPIVRTRFTREGGMMVADCQSPGVPMEQWGPNAVLFAASHDLLDALRDMVKWASDDFGLEWDEAETGAVPEFGGVENAYRLAFVAARAAIAKATAGPASSTRNASVKSSRGGSVDP